jgi:hypothetical protein
MLSILRLVPAAGARQRGPFPAVCERWGAFLLRVWGWRGGEKGREERETDRERVLKIKL